MVKLLRVVLSGENVRLLPFSFDKPAFADIPKIQEYASENEHTLFQTENLNKTKYEGDMSSNKKDLLNDFDKNRKYFHQINLKKVLCFEQMIKKLQKRHVLKSCYIKFTKYKRSPILYINDKKVGKLKPQINAFLKKYKKIKEKFQNEFKASNTEETDRF